MTHLKIIQNNTLADTEEVSQEIIQKLYDQAVSGDLDAEMKGRLHLTAGYRAQAEYLHQMFPNLIISADTYIIPFEDPKMVTYLNSIGVGSNGVITEADAAAATIVANSQNTEVTKFNELKYFTSITESRGGIESSNDGWVKFHQWTALEEVDISNFTSIGHNNPYGYGDIFAGCTSLKKVTASDKLAAIGHNAFANCSQLEDITGLEGTITIYAGAFVGNKKLKNSNFVNVEILFPPFTANTNTQFSNTNLITSLVLSDQNTCIPNYCFENSKIHSINIPTSITTIGKAAFKNSDIQLNASSLSNVTQFFDSCFVNTALTGTLVFNSNVDIIDHYCFQNTQLQSVDFSNAGNLSFLGRFLFSNCGSLTNATLPNSWTTLKEGIFYNCSNLATVNLSNIATFESSCLAKCSRLQTNMPQNIILNGGHAAFDSDINLQFPAQITVSSVNSDNRIGKGCFCNTSIQEVTIDSSIEILNSWCFLNCSSLKKINGLPNIKYLVQGVFEGCINLEGEVDLSNVVSVYLNERWDNQAQDDYLSYSFKNCQKITSVKLGHIEGFMSRNQQYDVKSPFYNCSMLHTVDVNSMDTIMITSGYPERGAFFTDGVGYECPSMRNFVLRCTTVPTIIGGGDASDINMGWFGGSQVTIYVPDSALNDYKTAWAAIASNIKGISEYTPIV